MRQQQRLQSSMVRARRSRHARQDLRPLRIKRYLTRIRNQQRIAYHLLPLSSLIRATADALNGSHQAHKCVSTKCITPPRNHRGCTFHRVLITCCHCSCFLPGFFSVNQNPSRLLQRGMSTRLHQNPNVRLNSAYDGAKWIIAL